MNILKKGDWLTLGAGILLVFFLFQQGKFAAEQAVVRSRGEVFAQLSLARNRLLSVPGPLGNTIVEIRNGEAKIAADPSPRQYCVREGWLKNAGDIAICLPNQVSLELIGGDKKYDSFNY